MLSINEDKTIILTEKFFPQTGNADLLDIINHPGGARPWANPAPDLEMLDIPEELIECTLAKLPNKKALGLDEILNEALKLVRKIISPGLSRVLTDFFKRSEIL